MKYKFKQLEIPKDKNIINDSDTKIKKILCSYTTISTGCENFDYITLFHNIRKNKYTSILECGSGVSTIVIAYALYLNHKENGIFGVVDSMEEIPKYYDFNVSKTPNMLKPYINYILSPCVYDHYAIFRGRRYEKTPKKYYDFCWIDGPEFKTDKKKGKYCFDFDLIYILLNNASKKPTAALIDGRYSTIYVMKKLFGKHVILYEDKTNSCVLGIIQPIVKNLLKIKHKGDYKNLINDLEEDGELDIPIELLND